MIEALSWAETRQALMSYPATKGRLPAVYEPESGVVVDLDGIDLSKFYLPGAYLRGVNLDNATLTNANLAGADLTGASLRNVQAQGIYLNQATLTKANLEGGDFSHARAIRARLTITKADGASFRFADLTGAIISGWWRRADLHEATLIEAALEGADLYRVNLSGAMLHRAVLGTVSQVNLDGADLSGARLNGCVLDKSSILRANVSGTTGLLDPADWLEQHFEKTAEGYLVYKAFGNTNFEPPDHWTIAPGNFITEVCNPDRTVMCACGINFATLGWIKINYPSRQSTWECLLHWRDLAGVTVPYQTDGKARCGRLQLLREL